MRDRFPYSRLLLPLVTIIIVRQAFTAAAFRGEYVLEDFTLLLVLVFAIAPLKLKRLIWLVITCSASAIMALIAWTTLALHRFSVPQTILSTIMFSLLAAYSAVLFFVELVRLRKQRSPI